MCRPSALSSCVLSFSGLAIGPAVPHESAVSSCLSTAAAARSCQAAKSQKNSKRLRQLSLIIPTELAEREECFFAKRQRLSTKRIWDSLDSLELAEDTLEGAFRPSKRSVHARSN